LCNNHRQIGDVVFETFCYSLSQRLKILVAHSLISPIHSEISQIIAVNNREYISLCRKAYKYVNLLHICVNMEKRIRMNISLTKKENVIIKKIAKEEERPYSRQIVYMTNFYIKNNKLRGKLE
jgi:hypothetical protein